MVAQTLLIEHAQRVSHAVLMGTNPPGQVGIPIQQVFLERAFKPVNDLADEEVLFFEPKSEASRKAAKASRERIYARPDVVSRIPSKIEEIQAFIAAAQGFGEDKAGRREKLIATRTPILVICGDHDTSTASQTGSRRWESSPTRTWSSTRSRGTGRSTSIPNSHGAPYRGIPALRCELGDPCVPRRGRCASTT